MKLFCSLLLILSCVNANANAHSLDTTVRDKQIQYETLIKQRNNQRTAGIVLWVTGQIIGTIGTVRMIASLGENNSAGAAIVAGMGMAVTGIGLLVSSWIKTKKAKALLRTGTSKIEFNNKNYVTQYSVGIALTL